MKANAILAGLKLLSQHGLQGVDVTGIAFDNRQVRPGDLFVAIKGARFDGHDAIADALERGASLVVGTEAGKVAVAPAYVVVADAREALALCANNFFGRPGQGLRLVGVTGTNGKTTFTYVLEAALTECGVSTGVIGTVDARYGETVRKLGHTTPEAPTLCGLLAEMRDGGVDVAIAEVSSHGLALKRVHGLDFAVAVFTNLSQDHLDFHANLEDYGEVKASFFTELLPASSREPQAVINYDDEWGRTIAERLEYPVYGYGIDAADAGIRASALEGDLNGMTFVAHGPWGELTVHTRMVGRHNVENILAVLATVYALGADVRTAARGIASLAGVPGRLEAIPNNLGFGVWVDYCHTPDAIEKVLVALRDVVPGRVITVFGAGGDRDASKRPLMGAAVQEGSDVAVVTSDNPRSENPQAIIDDIVDGMDEGYRFQKTLIVADRTLAIEAATGLARPGDGVLIGGKGHEQGQQVGDEVRPFDDRQVARQALAAMEATRA